MIICYNIYQVCSIKGISWSRGVGDCMYYASIGVLSIIIHSILNYDAMKNPRGEERTEAHERYRFFLYSISAYYIADILWGVFYETRIVPLSYFDTVMYFLTIGFTVYFWMRFVVAFLRQDNIFSKISSKIQRFS